MQLENVFDYDGYKVRTVVKEGQIWFVAKDVCDVLDLLNSRKATERLDSDDKDVITIYTPSGLQDMTIINESGLYNLILTSRKDEAKKFKKWITSQVLPEIRKTGSYTSKSMTNAEMILAQAQELVAHERMLAEHENKIQDGMFLSFPQLIQLLPFSLVWKTLPPLCLSKSNPFAAVRVQFL